MIPPKLEPLKLHEHFEYRDGRLYWRASYRDRFKGWECGSIDTKGRRRVSFGGRTYGAHAIVFAMHHGRWANGQIDHINRDKLDNRIENLREATNAENSRNRVNTRLPKSGARGVSYHKGRYIARITINGKSINLGSFDDCSTAAAAYAAATRIHHGEFAAIAAWNTRAEGGAK